MRYLVAISTTRTHGFGTQRLVGYLNFKVYTEWDVTNAVFCRRGQFFHKHIFLEHRWFCQELYPRKEFRLPDILSQEQVIHLLQSIKTPNTNSSLGCFTAPECDRRTLPLKNGIHRPQEFSDQNRGRQGNKDRFTLLPGATDEMETYYRHYRPKTYFFEGHKAERSTTSVAFKTPCARP
jgi:hypothetical protein